MRTADRFNAGAAVYEDVWAPVLLPHAHALVAGIPLAGADRILEIGAGVGRLLPELRSAAPAATIVGVDVSSGMLSRAPRDYVLAVMDASRLALADERDGATFALSSWEGEPHFPAQVSRRVRRSPEALLIDSREQ